MRIFYVIYLKGGMVSDCLNAIRMLARPNTRHPAHITVRGPCGEEIDTAPFNQYLKDISIVVDGVDRFLNPDQCVTFLTCHAPDLKNIWWKPDYPLFIPHLTLYQGPSLEFAQELYMIARQYSYRLRYHPNILEPLIVGGKAEIGSRIPFFSEEYIQKLLQEDMTMADVINMSLDRRLAAIDHLCRHLSHVSDIYQEPIESLTWEQWFALRKNQQ